MKIVCLANSFRLGGRCVGGVELDANNNPVLHAGRPKWIRPVLHTAHEEVPVGLVSNISLLDIIEFDVEEVGGHGHQTENVVFIPTSLSRNGTFPNARANEITDNNRFPLLFGNRGAAVPETNMHLYTHSLTLLEVTNFEVNERVFPGKPFPQKKLSFTYNTNNYNLPITDPAFIHRYDTNRNLLQGVEKTFLTVSLSAPNETWLYKLVAGIIF